jgi:Tfp pilus assembly protein PilV
MAIVFVNVTVFLVGFRLLAMMSFQMMAVGMWLIARKNPKMFQLWASALTRSSTMTRASTEQIKHTPSFATAGGACSIVPISRFVSPDIFALKGEGYPSPAGFAYAA